MTVRSAHARRHPPQKAKRRWLLPAVLLGGAVALGGGYAGYKVLAKPSVEQQVAVARGAIAKRDWGSAQAAAKAALDAQPESAEARRVYAEALIGSGDFANAETQLRRAQEAGAPDTELAPLMVRALVGQGKANEALVSHGRVNLPDPAADAQLKVSLAEAEAQSGQLDAALDRVDAALRAVPNHPQALLLGARLKAAKGNSSAALAQAEQVIAQNPQLVDAHLLKGELLTMQLRPTKDTDTKDVLAAYEQALKVQPDNVAAHAAIVSLHMAQGRVDAANTQWQAMKKVAPGNPQTHFLEAVLADARDDFKRVREVSQNLLRTLPNNPRLLLLAGRAESRLGAPAQAEFYYAKAASLVPRAVLPRRLLAQSQVSTGQPDKALLTLKPLLESNPPDAEALTLASQAYLVKGDNAKAEALLAQLNKQKPDSAKVRTAMAMLSLSKGQDPAAERELAAVAEADKGTTADMALITARLRAKDTAGALKAVDRLATKLPDSPMPAHLRGRIALQANDTAAARKHFEAAVAKSPDYLPALAALSMMDLTDKKPTEATARFNAVLERNPKNAAAMVALSEIAARSGGTADAVLDWLQKAVAAEPGDVGIRLRLVEQLAALGRLKPALDTVQTGLATQPDSLELLEREGRLHLAMGSAQQAVTSFSRLTSVAPQSTNAQLMLADAQSAAKNRAGVASAIAKAAELSPDTPEVLRAQFQLAAQDDKRELALVAARKLQTKYPDLGLGFALEASLEAQQKKWPAAAALLRKALATKQPGDSAIRLHQTLLAGGDAAEATRMADDWRRKNPSDLVFAEHLGGTALVQGDLAKAEALFREIVAKAPRHVPALNNLAYALAEQNKPGAVATAETALAIAPNALEVRDTYALALAREGQLPKALTVQAEVVQTAPDRPAFRLQLAKLHLQAGDKKSAADELKTLAKLGPSYPKQDEVATLLKKALGS